MSTRHFASILRGALRVLLVLGGIDGSMAAPAPPPVDAGIPIGMHLQVLEDPAATLTLADVRSPAHASRFASSTVQAPNFGYSRSAWWLRFQLDGSSEPDRGLVLEVRFPPLDSLEFHYFDGGAWRVARAGDLLPATARAERYHHHIFRFERPAAPGVRDYYLRVVSDGVLIAPLYLWREKAFARHSYDSQLLLGLFYGANLALALYNLLLFFSLRDRTYLYYVAYVVAFGIALFALDGLASQYLWPDSVWWSNRAAATLLSFGLGVGALFSQSFLGARRVSRVANGALMAVCAASFALMVAAPLDWTYRHVVQSLSLLAIVGAGTVVYLTIRALQSGFRPARFFLVAWLALMLFTVITALRNFGMVPSNFVTMNGLYIGHGLGIVLLSLAIGDRIKLTHELEKREQFVRETFGRYLSDDIVARLLSGPGGQRLGGEKRQVSILMADLRGFTQLSADLAADQVVAMLNHYLGVMTEVIQQHHGTIDEFIGDAILTIFGAPLAQSDHAERAVACALDMQRAMTRVNRWTAANNLPELEMGIAVNSGEVVVGNIGSAKRAKYGVVGHQVNLASRIESLTVGGDVLVSDSTRQAVRAPLRLTGMRLVRLKGVGEPLAIHAVGGIGAPYNIELPACVDALVTLPRPLEINFTVMLEKVVCGRPSSGRIMRLSERAALIESALVPEVMQNLAIRLADGPVGEPEFYAKVLTAEERTFMVRFTFLPDAVRTALGEAVSADNG